MNQNNDNNTNNNTLEALTARRDQARTQFQAVFRQKQGLVQQLQHLTQQMKELEDTCMQLDDEIEDALEMQLLQENDNVVKREGNNNKNNNNPPTISPIPAHPQTSATVVAPLPLPPTASATQWNEEFLTDPNTQTQTQTQFSPPPSSSRRVSTSPPPSRATKQNTLDSYLTHPPSNNNNKRRQSSSWTDAHIDDLLHHTFRIPSFRPHQREIIQATLNQRDVFCIMRTGGGKSLTYQLPALLEHDVSKKVTICVSPLLSLIQDQQEQMNGFRPGSATSFVSGVSAAEQDKRWKSIHSTCNSSSNKIALILVTPEKVVQSKAFQRHLQKLHTAGRLGRIVVDEAHCACQWGCDFRPDYAQLGILKDMFPTVPTLCVTATASARVREGTMEILHLVNPLVVRSTAARPNLYYSIRTKPDSSTAATILDDMAAFIQEKHKGAAGIVYTTSRNQADTVATELCHRGILARPYHAHLTPHQKQQLQAAWMRNQVQVVVATIAFGLGIHKADVRFVLHHSLSKTLEAYYQESGRAGRDGLPADCVLYYQPKDVPRLIKLIHSSSKASETDQHLFSAMIRYAQQQGNDAICRAILLHHLGEYEGDSVAAQQRHQAALEALVAQNPAVTVRDVGRQAQTIVQWISNHANTKYTLPQLVKECKSSTGLTAAECDRIVIVLFLEDVLNYQVVPTAYDAAVYWTVDRLARPFLASENPHLWVAFPNKIVSKQQKQTKQTLAVSPADRWIQVAPRPPSRSTSTTKKKKATAAKKTKAKTAPKRKKTAPKVASTAKKQRTARKKAPPKQISVQPEIIEVDLSSEDDDEVDDATLFGNVVKKSPPPAKKARSAKKKEDDLWDTDSEYEFED